MSDSLKPNSEIKDNSKEQNLSFAVMPHENLGDFISGESLPSAKTTLMNGIPLERDEQPHMGIWRSKTSYIFIGLLVIAALGAAAYFLLGSDTDEPAQLNVSSTRLPKIFLQQNFGYDVCENITVCGDKADPDNDGLDNYNEFKQQTNPKDNDSDKDGIADGDEVFVFLTDPIKKYTDPRPDAERLGYHDGSQLKNEYDPLTPGLKMTDARKAQINSDKAKNGLHEPSLTTFAASAPKTTSISISNNKFDAPVVTVNVNDTVTWVNKDLLNHQIASDPHPDHTLLPDLESGMLATNQVYSYKFTTMGTFTYHDHLNPNIKGTIIVQ